MNDFELSKLVRDNFATGMKHEGCGGDMIPLATLEMGAKQAAVPMRFVVCMDCKDEALELALQDTDAIRQTLTAIRSDGFWMALDALSDLIKSAAQNSQEITDGYIESLMNMHDKLQTKSQKSERKDNKSETLLRPAPDFINRPWRRRRN